MGDQSQQVYQHICFAPSEYFGNAPESRKFGEKIAEVPIIIDYLKETGVLTLSDIVKDLDQLGQIFIDDWWDKLNKEKYVDMLIKRHNQLANKKDQLMKDNFQWPDISTNKRNRKEYYEIKPNSPTGLYAGQKKMKNIKEMYDRYRLSFYRPGVTYPLNNKKKIKLLSKFELNLKYLLDLELEELGVDIFEIYMDLIRAEDGLLLYKFCVRFRMKEKKQKLAKHVAARILTHFIRTTTVDLGAETIRTIMVAVSKLEIVEINGYPVKQPEPISAVTNVNYVPMLNLRWGATAGELDNQLDTIRNAMFSRFIGKPRERYFICSDKNYYQQVHLIPARARDQTTADLMRVKYQMVGFGPRNMAYVVPRMTNLSIAELMQMKEWDEINKKRENLMAGTVFVATCVVVITAASVVAIAGAPIAIVTGATSTGGAVTGGAAAAGAVGEGVVAAGGATAAGAVGEGVVAAGSNVVYLPAAPVKMIAAAASIMLLAAPSDARAAVPDEVLTGRATHPPSLASWAVDHTNDARVLRTLGEQGVKKAIEEAVALGDVGLISISAAPVYERDSQTNPGNRIGMPPVGRLYLVKVKDSIGKLPTMYQEFPVSEFASEKQRFSRMHFFGSFTVDSPSYP
ncbi:hypothetical protein [Cohnella mopanensis]|uniref:hypothetical protein n=1 Tax=Cohnella mopanensis TaxID=2911966 RepID=UPI001EF825EC|nr:hypothetical protein [Cohnella mopanensis]